MSDRLLTAAKAMVDAYGGNVPDWLQREHDQLSLAIAAIEAETDPKTLEAKALEAFEATGATVVMFGGNCPVQAEGLIDGKLYYFRARGTRWEWHVADTALDLWKKPLLFIERTYSDELFSAGWMPKHEALGFMLEGVKLWRLQRELMEAHEGQGNADRIDFKDWVRNMALDATGTLQDAARAFIAGFYA